MRKTIILFLCLGLAVSAKAEVPDPTASPNSEIVSVQIDKVKDDKFSYVTDASLSLVAFQGGNPIPTKRIGSLLKAGNLYCEMEVKLRALDRYTTELQCHTSGTDKVKFTDSLLCFRDGNSEYSNSLTPTIELGAFAYTLMLECRKYKVPLDIKR